MNIDLRIEKQKIRAFADLRVWQEGHKLVVGIYKITKSFPREEMYSLIDQMRRAATSITSNIAEGFGRHSYKEKVQFYYLAQGSLLELENQLLISKDVGYLKEPLFSKITSEANVAHQLLQGLITKSKTFINPKS
ncbi:four helix bundle protein [Candidatus Giovannonibacteria bacterium]|nr:four helix bundle protein [Candidatus Giovannonibacteria bacterium]